MAVRDPQTRPHARPWQMPKHYEARVSRVRAKGGPRCTDPLYRMGSDRRDCISARPTRLQTYTVYQNDGCWLPRKSLAEIWSVHIRAPQPVLSCPLQMSPLTAFVAVAAATVARGVRRAASPYRATPPRRTCTRWAHWHARGRRCPNTRRAPVRYTVQLGLGKQISDTARTRLMTTLNQ